MDYGLSTTEAIIRRAKTLISELSLAPVDDSYNGDPGKDSALLQALIAEAPTELARQMIAEDVIALVEKNTGDITCLQTLAEYWYSSLLLPSKRPHGRLFI